MGGGGSSAPATTPLPSQAAANPNNGQTAIQNAPKTTTVDETTTDSSPTDRGVSSLRIKRSKGGSGTSVPPSGTGLNIPT
jgi:hypothetical protein